MTSCVKLIEKLSLAFGPTGCEGEVEGLIRAELAGLPVELMTDRMGNLTAHLKGVHGLHVLVEREVRILNLQQRRNHTGLPVVAVDDVGLEAQVRQRVDDRAAEEAEALVLVAAQTVDVAAAKVELVVHEVEGHALILQRLDAAVLLAPAELNLELALGLHLGSPLFRDGRIQRQDHAHIGALLLEHRRQRAHNVGQAAGFDKRHALGRGKQNLHIGLSSLKRRDCTLKKSFLECAVPLTFFVSITFKASILTVRLYIYGTRPAMPAAHAA